MKQIANDSEVVVTDEDGEVTVEVSYRCHFAPGKAFYPMTVNGSIHKNLSLQDFIARGKKSYERDYLKVEVVKVEIDEDELEGIISKQQ